MNSDRSFQAMNRAYAACMTGIVGVAGSFVLLDLKSLKAVPLSERQLVALSLVVILSLVIAGAPAGWAAGKHFACTASRVWLAMAGAYLVPMLSWFAGLDVHWPMSWLTAAVLIFAGSWLGYGLSFLFWRKEPMKMNKKNNKK